MVCAATGNPRLGLDFNWQVCGLVFVIAALHYSSAATCEKVGAAVSAVQQYSITPGWSGLLGLSNKKFTVCNKAMRRVPYKQRYGTPACKTAHCLSVNRVVNGPPPIHAFLSARSRMKDVG